MTIDSEARQLVIRLPDLTLSALAWGPEDGPLALCLHGFPDSAWTWRLLGPALGARGWRVVAPFLRGYAPSDLAHDDRYTIAALMDDVEHLHEALGGDGRAVLIGHDWGAITTYGIAAATDCRFARIVTLAIPPFPSMLAALGRGRRLATLRIMLPRVWYIAAAQVPVVGERVLSRAVRRIWTSWSPGYEPNVDLDLLADSLGSAPHWRAALRYYRAMLRRSSWTGASGARQRLAFAAPRRPALVLHGRDDGVASHRLAADAGAHLPPGSEATILDDCGHFLHLERPSDVNAAVLAFVGPA